MRSALALLSLLALPASASAQAPRIAPRPSIVFAQSTLTVTSRPANLPETHWKTGAIIGGVGLGVLGAVAMQGVCETESCATGAAIGGFLIGGFIGGITGALIGGQIPKGAPAE
jgi:hypothetical protein